MTSVALPSIGEKTRTELILRRVLPYIGYTVLIIFAVIEIVPFAFTLVNSFKCLPAISSSPMSFIPVPPFNVECVNPDGTSLPASATTSGMSFNPTLDGYEEVFSANIGRWTLNSVMYSVVITLLRIIFDSMAGYALARLKFRGSRVLFFAILGTMMIPGVVLIIPRFLILKQLNFLGTFQGVVFPLMADAFGIFLMKQFFESIPGEIEEAAQVDGADRFTIFFRIVLPMATPALTALTIFSFQGIWNNMLDILIIVGGNQDLWNLPVGLAYLRGPSGQTLRWHQFLAGSVITTLPLAIIFFAFQRYFVEGVSYSGLKG